jgi:hypothetical protein
MATLAGQLANSSIIIIHICAKFQHHHHHSHFAPNSNIDLKVSKKGIN